MKQQNVIGSLLSRKSKDDKVISPIDTCQVCTWTWCVHVYLDHIFCCNEDMSTTYTTVGLGSIYTYVQPAQYMESRYLNQIRMHIVYLFCPTHAGSRIPIAWCTGHNNDTSIREYHVKGPQKIEKALPSNFFQPCCAIALVYQSFCSHMIADRFQYDWIAEKI